MDIQQQPMNNLVNEIEDIKKALDDRLEAHDNNRKAAQDKLHEICEGLRKQIDEFENKINSELENKFNKEDSRLQNALSDLRDIDMDKLNDNNINEFQQVIQKVKAELLVVQSYDIIQCGNKGEIFGTPKYEEPAMKKKKTETKQKLVSDFTKMWELKVDNKIMLEMRKLKGIKVIGIKNKKFYLQFTNLNPDETRILSEHNIEDPFKYKCLFYKKTSNLYDEQSNKEYLLDKMEGRFTFTPDSFETGTIYTIKVKMILCGKEGEWSDGTDFKTPEFSEYCVWERYSSYIKKEYKCYVDENNPRTAIKVSDCYHSVVFGNTYLPLNNVTSWNIKILKSKENDGKDIHIGIALFDINQNEDNNYSNYGWYFNCYDSSLRSGPPHNYEGKEYYGPRKRSGEYVYTGDSIGVIMDTTKGELSFVLNRINLGTAYEGIPLDKPLVPCVILKNKGDSVELDTTQVKETKVDNSISTPSNIIVKSESWDSITLTWDVIEGASFYQIEVDETNHGDASTTNAFTKRGLLPETEHTFRVRAVKNNKMSEWSNVMKRITVKKSFENSGWKECLNNVDGWRKYSVDEKNPRIITKIDNWGYSTAIGNTPLPLNIIISWNIIILKSKENVRRSIFIGVAPFDIIQDDDDNYRNCGWYYCCYDSTLWSGPSHNYKWKMYGPRKEKGKYVYTGDSVGVVMDTAKGDLSFVVNSVNLGVAYKSIPLDKPLVPCVILWNKSDSVGLITK